MKQGVSSYSFEQYLGSGRMTLTDVIVKAAQMGFEGVELANITGSGYAHTIEGLKRTADDSGIEICAWATSANFEKDLGEQIEALKEEIDRAHFVGAKVLRTDIYHSDVAQPYRPRAIDALRQLADYAQHRGIALTTENHGGYFCLSDRLERLFEQVDHPNFGLLCDFANFLDADEDPAHAVKRLAARIRHVHVKDCHLLDGSAIYPGEGWYVTRAGNYLRCAITGHGNAPIDKCIKSLAQAGYTGYLVQEFEGIEDCLTALGAGLKYTRRLIECLPQGMWSE